MTDLCELGLTSYENQAYWSLLACGPIAAQDLAELSGVPSGRIYDVLESLEANRFVRVQRGSRPKQYIAVEPEIAINRYIEKEMDELEADKTKYRKIGKNLVEELPSLSLLGRWSTPEDSDWDPRGHGVVVQTGSSRQ
jgi:sugar-specific transcriptional regulator TrmB